MASSDMPAARIPASAVPPPAPWDVVDMSMELQALPVLLSPVPHVLLWAAHDGSPACSIRPAMLLPPAACSSAW